MKNRIIKYPSIMFLVVFIVSCVNESELELVKKSNAFLTYKVDSLEHILDEYEVLTVLNNNNFKADVGETYRVESMAVLKSGLIMDSLFLNGRYISDKDGSVEISEGFFGPIISIRLDTIGDYNLTAFVSSFAWESKRSVKTEWTVVAE